LRRWWCRYICDEDPDSRIERIRKEGIEDMRVYADLHDTKRPWELEPWKRQQPRHEPLEFVLSLKRR
jgi:hypothetical protein